MAEYRGYVDIPHTTYQEWRTATIGNSYDVDGTPILQPFQCWDFASEFWRNLGFSTGYPITGGNDAKGVWYNRETNKGDVFDLIYDISLTEVGDVLCFSIGQYGHIGFLDEPYQSGGYVKLLSQNVSSPYVTSENYGTSTFQGAFRYKGWHNPPTPIVKTHRFPFVLYAKRLRELRQGL